MSAETIDVTEIVIGQFADWPGPEQICDTCGHPAKVHEANYCKHKNDAGKFDCPCEGFE